MRHSCSTGIQTSDAGSISKVRYVLSYEVEEIPIGLKLFPRTVNKEGVEQYCCISFGNWHDPHLGHAITFRCQSCLNIVSNHGKAFHNVNFINASYSVVNADDGKLNHLVVKCTACPLQNIGKIRILRRGREPVYGGRIPTPILDVTLLENGIPFPVETRSIVVNGAVSSLVSVPQFKLLQSSPLTEDPLAENQGEKSPPSLSKANVNFILTYSS